MTAANDGTSHDQPPEACCTEKVDQGLPFGSNSLSVKPSAKVATNEGAFRL